MKIRQTDRQTERSTDRYMDRYTMTRGLGLSSGETTALHKVSVYYIELNRKVGL